MTIPAFHPAYPCDAVRVWARLETRPRAVELDEALAARVADPLWMLTRQWQVGEFHGEDTGSAVMATLARRVSPVTAIRVGASRRPYAGARSLEAEAEPAPADPPAAARAQLGRLILDEVAARLAADGSAGDAASYRPVLARRFPLAEPELDPANSSHLVPLARRRAAGAAARVRAALAARAFDGAAFLRSLPPRPSLADLPAELVAVLAPGDAPAVLEVVGALAAWHAELAPNPVVAPGWDASRLGYDVGCSVPRAGAAPVEVAARPGAQGRWDWHAFDTVRPPAAAAPTAPAGGSPASGWDVVSVIPTAAEYAGMPTARWWQLEDSAVSLVRLRADAGDLAKILVTEFATIYGNNWLAIPVEQPLGSLSEIAGIVVTDVFGRRSLVRAATGASGPDWSAWDLFSLSPAGPGGAVLGQHLWLPPSAPEVLDGPVVEEAVFVRDEGANTVWAVETRTPDGLGGGRDGAEAARRAAAELGRLREQAESGAAPPSPAAAARWSYRLGGTVPEHWIPFLPVRLPGSADQVRLQRGAMPRFFPAAAPRVRPVTDILRPGLAADDTQHSPFYVHEEEVSRAGEVVRTRMRRARWVDGSVTVWAARTRGSGRGEGSSGLVFDRVTPVEQPGP